jgi:DNA polymerase-1
MSKLVLIDGNAILHRAYHALPPLTSKSGEPINAVYGFVSMLLRVVTDLKPSHIAVAFDRPEPTFRHKQFKNYQAQRPTMDKELSGQFEKVKATVAAFGIPIYEKAGYEADDVLGTLAVRAFESKRAGEHKSIRMSKKTKISTLPPLHSSTLINEIVIVTGDRDILQLVNDKIKVYLPAKGLSEAKLMEKADVVEKLGVEPFKVPDYKALVGDASDNYKGVAGIGPKTAINLINKYGSLDSIYKNLKGIPDSTREKLVKEKKSAELSFKLATIVKDVPIEADFDSMKKWKLDSPAVLSLFKEFGFKTLTKRVKEVDEKMQEEKQARLF